MKISMSARHQTCSGCRAHNFTVIEKSRLRPLVLTRGYRLDRLDFSLFRAPEVKAFIIYMITPGKMLKRITSADELYDAFRWSCLFIGFSSFIDDLLEKQEVYRTPDGYLRLFEASDETGARYMVVDAIIPYYSTDFLFLEELVADVRSRGYTDLLFKSSYADTLVNLLAYCRTEMEDPDLVLQEIQSMAFPSFSYSTKTLTWVGELPKIHVEHRKKPTFTADYISLFAFYDSLNPNSAPAPCTAQ